jgi:hypothetical protein
MSQVKMKQVGSLLVPESLPEKIGFGCPKCDDHELVPANQRDHNVQAIVMRFRDRHRGCGELEALEERSGRLYITGKIPALS